MSATADADRPRLPARRSLRAKGMLATLALLLYVLASAAFVSIERAALRDSVEALQQLSRHEKALALTEAAVSGAVLDLHAGAAGEPALPQDFALYMESCAKMFAALDEFDSAYAPLERAIARSYAHWQEMPARAQWVDLRESLGQAARELEGRRDGLTARREVLTEEYQRRHDAITLESLLLSALGIAGFGALAAWFFARLSRDIGRLEAHARRIVHGSRGVALPITRQDELGQLICAVNRLAADLDAREKRIEIEEQRSAYQDKMTAVGALAAGVAHEVNNPLAVIAGVAQELGTAQAEGLAQRVQEGAQIILEQTQRAAQAARHLAQAAAPQPTELDWIDLNSVLRQVVQLLSYDKRYRHVVFECDLGTDLPAVRAPAAALQQVLMQLLGVGCDAASEAPGPATVLLLRSRHPADGVEIELQFPARLDTEQPAVRRALAFGRATLEPLRGRIDMSQGDALGQHLKLIWPATAGGAEQG